MKNILLTALFSMGAMCMYAQNIGIGTGTPHTSALLEMASSTKGLLIPRMTTAQRTAIAGPASGLMVFDNTTSSLWTYTGASWTEVGNASPGFWTANNTHIYSSNSGNVGMGTTSPIEKLHIQSGKIFVRDNRASNNPHIIFDIPAVDWKEGGIQWYRTGDTLAALNYVANPNTPNYVRISMQNKGTTPDLVVNTNGNTGLGTVNPQVKLHLLSRLATEMVKLEGENPLIQLKRRTSLVNSIFDTYKDVGFLQTSGDNLRIGTNSDNNSGKFVIRVNGGDRMFVDPNGNVSIGTETVASGYRLTLAGKMMCEELKVQVQAAWPDYVFTDQYPLMPLKDLRSFITANGHLPNIPKADIIEKNGLEMGDMQSRMMEKIEELTLYILELQQQIDELKHQPAKQ